MQQDTIGLFSSSTQLKSHTVKVLCGVNIWASPRLGILQHCSVSDGERVRAKSGDRDSSKPTSHLKEQPRHRLGDSGAESPMFLSLLPGNTQSQAWKMAFCCVLARTPAAETFSPNVERLYLSKSLHSVCLKGSARE